MLRDKKKLAGTSRLDSLASNRKRVHGHNNARKSDDVGHLCKPAPPDLAGNQVRFRVNDAPWRVAPLRFLLGILLNLAGPRTYIAAAMVQYGT